MGGDSKWTLAVVGVTLVVVAAVGFFHFRDSLKANAEGSAPAFDIGARGTSVLLPFSPVRGSETERDFRVLSASGFHLAEMKAGGAQRVPLTFVFLRREANMAATLVTDRSRSLYAGISVPLTPGRVAEVREAISIANQIAGKPNEARKALWGLLESYVGMLGRHEGDGAGAAVELADASNPAVASLLRKGISRGRLCLGIRMDDEAVWWRVAPLTPPGEKGRPEIALELGDDPPEEMTPFLLSEAEILRKAGAP